MKIRFIKLFNQEEDGYLFFYATINDKPLDDPSHDCKFQWYMSPDETSDGVQITDYHSNGLLYPLSTDYIRECGYANQYMYCIYENIHTHKVVRTKPVCLKETFSEMVDAGVVFDFVDAFDKDGHFVKGLGD